MTRSETEAFNRGVAAVVAVAQASASALRTKLKEKPTRYGFALEALEAIVEAGTTLILPLPESERK